MFVRDEALTNCDIQKCGQNRLRSNVESITLSGFEFALGPMLLFPTPPTLALVGR